MLAPIVCEVRSKFLSKPAMRNEAIQYLLVADIFLGPQVRECADDQSIRNLAASLREVGQLQPVRVRHDGERLVVVDGERRFRAAKLLGWERIAAIIEEKQLCSAEIIQRQLIANVQRKNLSSVQIAVAIEELIKDTGLSASEVARKLGLSPATVARLRALLKLPISMQEQVQDGSLPASTAYAIGKVSDPTAQTELAHGAANGQLTRDAATRKVKQLQRRRAATKRIRRPRFTAPLGTGRSLTISGPDLDIDNLIAWLDELLGKARVAQSQGADLVVFAQALRDQASA